MLNYRQYYDVATPGRIWGTQSDLLIKPYLNGSPGDKEQWTVTLPETPTANTVYGINVNSYLVQVNSGSSPTTATLKAQFLNAFSAQLSSSFVPAQMVASNLVTATDGGDETLLITARKEEQVLSVITSGANLTASRTTPATTRESIGFGLIVVADPSNWKAAMLPTGSGNRVVGVTLNPYDIEKDAFGEAGKACFVPDEPMDVLARTNGAEGIWVHAVEPNLVPGDPIYVSYAAGSRGKVTKSSTNAIALGSIASFQSPSQTVNLTQSVALVQFNLI